MSDEKEQPFIMCVRTTEEIHVPSVIRMCTKCAHEIWISHASLDLAKKNNAQFICFECFMKRLESLPPDRKVVLAPMTEEQMKEIKEYL